jgi:hypothetical protein
MSENIKVKRQILYWNTLSRIFSDKKNKDFDKMSKSIMNEYGLPNVLLDDNMSIDNICQRYPEIKDTIEGLSLGDDLDNDSETEEDEEIKRASILGKLINNILGNNDAVVSATTYSNWCKDMEYFESACGLDKGSIRGKNADNEMASYFKEIEEDLIKRMQLREILKDDELVEKLNPGIGLVEQLLRDKSNLSDIALKNAKKIIKQYVDDVSEQLRNQVQQTSKVKIDYSVPPKRVFKNLDLNRTIWKNLTNWNPNDNKLYVDKLFYKHTTKKTLLPKLIVVVDQSGSMVNSMVNCAILASIFSTIEEVDASLIAYDTKALDLTEWVKDPFEVLMRTDLGGGNDWRVAMNLVTPKIGNPEKTTLVWVSDYYEILEQELFNSIKSLKDSGVNFIPVGSVSSSGYHSVNSWFKTKFKQMGCPVISGNIQKLIVELKNFLA